MSLFDSYQPAEGRYDELVGADGQPRPHWRYLTEALGAMDDDSLRLRQNEVRRLLIEHGVTYKVYGKAAEKPRAWALDLLPLVIGSREWRDIEVGIAQRAELLRQILHDLYGKQRLIAQGLIPPELVYGHPGFLLPCLDGGRPADQALQIYAADLGRAPDGSFWVTGDRTQAPSGIGYALEARTITSRTLPSIFRESNVHPILPFLRNLRRCLVNLADGDPAQIALLTAGPANETYSEHAFLAQQLGIPLVEGSELEVSRGKAWLARAGARQSLRVLLRRMDDDYCDPLELNRASVLGSPGLLQAVRNRQLLFANPLGAGVVENPALMAFLPAVCKQLLGEELKLPSVQTWWCGRTDDLAQVRADFDNMVIRRLHQGPHSAPKAVARLKPEQRDELLARVTAAPAQFVAQRAAAQPTAPILDGRTVSARAVEIRTFAVANNDSFSVMAGGIARAGRNREAWRFSSQLGGVSKDIWVLASEPQRAAQTLPLFLPRSGTRGQAADQQLPVVGASNLIWFGRYASRAELLARMLREALKLTLEHAGEADAMLPLMLESLTWQTTAYPGFVGPLGSENLANPAPELIRLCAQTAEPNSLTATINSLREAADPLRELLSGEQWAQLNLLLHDINEPQDLVSALAQINQAHLRLAAISGLMVRTLPAGATRNFIEFGFRLERGLGWSRLLRSMLLESNCPLSERSALLGQLLDSTVTQGWSESPLAEVLENLLASSGNPQSLHVQLQMLDRICNSLPTPGRRATRRKIGLDPELLATVSNLDDAELRRLAMAAAPQQALEQLLQQVDTGLRNLATQIEASYSQRRHFAMQLRESA